MKKLVVVTIVTVLLVFALGCQNPLENTDLTAIAKSHKTPGGEAPLKGDLIAGKHIPVGTVTPSNDEANLYVTYSLLDGWVMIESHLAVASSLKEIPQTKKGNPIPGHFPFKSKHYPAVTEYTYTISLEDFEAENELYIAAHAVVQRVDDEDNVSQEESAWATGEEGDEFDGKNWATYFCYTERIWEGDFDIQNVDDLAGYTGITGSLTIRDTNLPNLAWLSSLTFVGGNLDIEYNSALTSLTGLEGLTSIGGGLSIWDNSALTTLAALESLTTVQGNIVIRDNPSLTDLTGLESLISIGGGLFIIENSALTSLSMLNNLTSIGGWLSISSTSSLVNLDGLEGLTSVGGYLEIGNNYALTSLTGLNNLNTAGGLVISGYNSVLMNLTGLEGLTLIDGELDIRYNTALISLVGLDNLATVAGDLKIRYNPALSTSLAEELAERVDVAGIVTIEGNKP